MTEERALIAATCERLFAAHLNEDVFRAAEVGEFPHELWNAITENGFDRVLLPENQGGGGLFWEDASEVIIAAGRHAAPVPLAETIAAIWLLGQAGIDVPNGIITLVMGKGDGTVSLPWGRDTAHAVAGNGTIRCVSLDGVRMTPDRNIGRDPRDTTADIPISDLIENPVQVVGALVRSCQMAGAVSMALDLSVEYANTRIQFGRPIGRFQAIQQQLAELAGEVAAADVAARDACRAIDRGGDFFAAAASAKIRTGEAAGKVANIAHQVHGAIGFTNEYRLHRLTRRLWAWRSEFGAENAWAESLGRRVLARGAENLWPDLTEPEYKSTA